MSRTGSRAGYGSGCGLALLLSLGLLSMAATAEEGFDSCDFSLVGAKGVLGSHQVHKFTGKCNELVQHPATKELDLPVDIHAASPEPTGDTVNHWFEFQVEGSSSWDRNSGEAVEELSFKGSAKVARRVTAKCTNDPFLDKAPGAALSCGNYAVQVKVDSGPAYEFYSKPASFLTAHQSPLLLAVSLSKESAAGPPPPQPPPPKPQPSAQPAPAVKSMSSPHSQAGRIAVEAESLLAQHQVAVSSGQLGPQSMQSFGSGWNNNAQLLWLGAGPGAVLDLQFDVPVSGKYAVFVNLTRAPDYGVVKFLVDGVETNTTFDGYAASVTGPVAQKLGRFQLQQGKRRISVMIVGKNPASSGFLCGVDNIVLRPAT